MKTCERPTLIERIVEVLPGPYVVKCIIFSCLFGVPLLLLTRFLDTLNVQSALAVFGQMLWQNVSTFSFANFVLLFYAVYGVRYMRSRAAATLSEAGPLMPTSGGKTVHDVFSPVCSLFPAIGVSLLIAAVSLLSFPDQGQHAAGPISFALIVISFPFVYLAYGTFIWVYCSSVNCLYNLGKQPLQLAEFYEDSHLGMKPFGSLSLSLALVYFAGIGLVFFSFISIPAPLEFALSVMIVGGLVLFFLPMNVLHRKMRDKKRLERQKINARHRSLLGSIGEPVQSILTVDSKKLGHILETDLINKQVNSIPEWPFDSRTLTWLSAIVLAVVVSIVTRYVTFILGA